MASPKRPTLAQSGIDKLFQSSAAPLPPVPNTSAATPTTRQDTLSSESWEATHRRRTFHCDNAVWDRLANWCEATGTSRSAAITQALEAFLADRGR